MKNEYNLSKMKRKGHPLRDKVARGEIKLIDPFNISHEEFRGQTAKLCSREQELIESKLFACEGQ